MDSMKIVISKSDLTTLCSKLQSIVTNKPAIPILANVLLEAFDDQLILNATDLTTSMRTYCSAKVIEEGAIALPARRFFQLIRELTSPQVKISAPSFEFAEITAGSSSFKVHGMQKNEFPTLPTLAGALQLSIAPTLLKDLLLRSSFSVSREDSRYFLNGILLQIANQTASFIGTDGKRLAKTWTKISADPSFQGAYILPLKAVEEMGKMLENSEKDATLSLTHDKVFLEHNNSLLITKLLAGQFPDVERAIPANPAISLNLHREELMVLLRQVSLFTSETSASVRFSFTTGQLELNATSSEIGEGIVNMPVDYAGEKIEIAFNPHYFLDILRHSKEETVRFCFTDSFNPGLVSDSTSALFAIMPMRLMEPSPTSPELHDSKKPAFA
jgi:DNA polymerase III subunit beta